MKLNERQLKKITSEHIPNPQDDLCFRVMLEMNDENYCIRRAFEELHKGLFCKQNSAKLEAICNGITMLGLAKAIMYASVQTTKEKPRRARSKNPRGVDQIPSIP